MLWNRKVETFEKLRMGKDWRFFKNGISIGREKYVFLLLFAWKMRDY